MATSQSLNKRHQDILNQYAEHKQTTLDVQREVLERVIPHLTGQLDDLDNDSLQQVNAFANDTSTIFRFLRRARFSHSTAIALLEATLQFRLSLPRPDTLPPNPYYSTPTFFFHPSLHDRFGRPAGVLNLRHVRRAQDGSLDALKDFVRKRWEEGRQLLARQSEEKTEPCLQMVLIVDLEGAGMANLEVELLPYFMTLLKNHFPGMVGAVFVLNYGWSFAGMWGLAKRVLPQTALDRILFPTKDDLLQFFDEGNLLKEHGGTVDYKYKPPAATSHPASRDFAAACPSPTASAPTSPRFPFPTKSLHPINTNLANSPHPAPTTDDDHDTHDVFHSARQTPHHSMPGTPIGGPSATALRRAHGLGMTSLSASHSQGASASHSPTTGWAFPSWKRNGGLSSGTGLRRVSSLAELQARLEEAQAEIGESESETGSSVGTATDLAEVTSGGASAVDVGEVSGEESELAGPCGGSSRATSPATSRMSSRAVSREHSRQVSPQRLPGASRISPYHPSNPHWGYPAYLPPPSTSATHPYGHAPIPQPHHHRRRKRDLARTLSYLAALRFLALHRALQRRIKELVASLWYAASLRWVWERRKAAPRSPELRRVHWAEGVGGREEESRWRWKRVMGWLVVVLVVLARRPRLRTKLAELSRRASRLGVEAAVGRPDGRRARAMLQGAELARWAGTKLIRQ